MIKRETLVSLLAGLLVGALGIAPVVAGDGFGFGPAQGGGGVTDAELLAIGALTPTDGNVIVGDGSTWVAESGATARASLGALGGSLGSTNNAILRSDGTGGVTAQGSDATLDDSEVLNLTTTGALALGTGTDDPRLVRTASDTLAVRDGSGNSSWIAGLGVETKDLSAYTTAAGAEAKNGNLRTVIVGSAFGGAIMASSYKLGWSSSTAGSADVGTTDDTALSRDSAGRVLVENGSGTAADLRAAGYVVGAASTTAGARFEMSGNNLTLREGDDSTGFVDTVDFATAPLLSRYYSASYTTDPITESNLNSGAALDNVGASGTITISLPSTLVRGVRLTYWIGAAQELRLDPAAGDKILDLDMTGLADGEYVVSSTLYSRITLMRAGSGDWIVLDKAGTWTEETP